MNSSMAEQRFVIARGPRVARPRGNLLSLSLGSCYDRRRLYLGIGDNGPRFPLGVLSGLIGKALDPDHDVADCDLR